MQNLKILLNLVKAKIALAITFTTFAGYFVFSSNFYLSLLFAIVGVFLMSAGALALNQYQERTYDAKMNRTMDRPMPNFMIKPIYALWISFVLIIAGLFVLYFYVNPLCALLGIFNVFWYNVVYTYLKRITVFAVIPGALVGAVPAIIGWCAAGGYILDFQIIVIALFLIIWQIPHFWLILYYYDNDYSKAGFPSITKSFSKSKIKNIVFVWLIATCASTALFPIFELISSTISIYILIAINFIILINFYYTLYRKSSYLTIKHLLAGINIYMVLVLVIMVVDRLVS